MFSGLFIGTALFGFVADRFGRRAIFTYSLLWYTAATVAMAVREKRLPTPVLEPSQFAAQLGLASLRSASDEGVAHARSVTPR